MELHFRCARAENERYVGFGRPKWIGGEIQAGCALAVAMESLMG
jgi:hypothetical protein